MFVTFEFCEPTKAIKVLAGPEWFRDIKYNCYRLRMERNGDRVLVIPRGGMIGQNASLGSLRLR